MSVCKRCGGEIFWAKTQRGKNMPVDPEMVLGGNLVYDRASRVVSRVDADKSVPRFVAHFDTCIALRAEQAVQEAPTPSTPAPEADEAPPLEEEPWPDYEEEPF